MSARRDAAHPFLFPCRSFRSMLARCESRGAKEFTVETRARTLHFHSREAPREPTSHVQRVLKSLQPSSSLFREGNDLRGISSSRLRMCLWFLRLALVASSVSLSLSRSALYVARASVDNVAPVVVIHIQLVCLDTRETCRHRSLY